VYWPLSGHDLGRSEWSVTRPGRLRPMPVGHAGRVRLRPLRGRRAISAGPGEPPGPVRCAVAVLASGAPARGADGELTTSGWQGGRTPTGLDVGGS